MINKTTVLSILFAAGALAQQKDVLIRREAKIVGPEHGATFEFISSEVGREGNTVKGAPYSAEAISENTQILSDGNRISRKSSTMLYRDSEGRIRREVSLGSIGPWAAAGSAPVKLVMIHDPVAGASYTLDEKTKTARKVAGKGMVFSYAASGPVEGVRIPAPPPAAGQGFEVELGPPNVHMLRKPASNNPNAKTESLGKRNIEGVLAEGTRTTLSIAAGEIGNERQIDVVTERWYSPELQTVVLTRHINPMSGENVYQLTNLRRDEPVKSLFEVPADYTIKAAGDIPTKPMIRKFESEK